LSSFARIAMVLVFALAVGPSQVFAQATRTWVSGVGDDVNPCSRTAPCKTFAGAISKTAAGGIINVLDPGGFGAVTITKSITIDGGGTDGSMTATGSGIIINAGANDHVTLRHLTIYGVAPSFSGIRVINASGHVTIANCVISGFLIGIDYNASGQLSVYEALVHNNSQFGALVRQGRGTFEQVRFSNNGYDGLRVSSGGVVTTRRLTVSDHSNIGLSAVDAGSRLTVEDSVVNSNLYGVGVAGGGVMHISNTLLSDNTALALYREAGSFLISFGNNRLANNAANGTFSSSLAVQ
jgi:hypothetical protein